MPLPIIICVERHWDPVPKKALLRALPFLTTSGYDTLCFESPCDHSQQETIGAIESTIAFIEARLAEANQYLAQRNLFDPLPDMDYLALQSLLQQHVSSRYYKEMALWFKELPGHQAKRQLVQKAIESRMNICGIDLTRELLAPINALGAQLNLSRRVADIDALNEARTRAFKKNLLELQQQGKGVVFLVGQSHMHDLIKEISKDYPLNEIMVLHPYSSTCLDPSYVDYHLPSSTAMEDFTLIEKTIGSDQDYELFLTDLKSTIQSRQAQEIAIAPTSTSQSLSEKTGLHFEAYVRPGYLVDGHHFFSAQERIDGAVAKLHDQGIHGFFSFFRGQSSYCVPNINMKDVASQIQKLR